MESLNWVNTEALWSIQVALYIQSLKERCNPLLFFNVEELFLLDDKVVKLFFTDDFEVFVDPINESLPQIILSTDTSNDVFGSYTRRWSEDATSELIIVEVLQISSACCCSGGCNFWL